MRPKLEVADIFRRHGDAFRTAQGNRLSHEQRKVMAAIEACRTQALGGHVERCEDCGVTRIAFNSCRDRHCPKCQGLARLQWLADRRTELLPVPYFHIVFTVHFDLTVRRPPHAPDVPKPWLPTFDQAAAAIGTR
jgi:hypothetical protein